MGYIIQSLTDRFLFIRAGCDVEHPLIGSYVLHDRRRLAVHCENYGALALLKLLHEVAGPTPESRQRLNVLGEIKHSAPVKSTSLGAVRILLRGEAQRPLRDGGRHDRRGNLTYYVAGH